MPQLYLGLDSSTQSISAFVIDYDSRVTVYEHSVNFDQSFPAYGTQNGALRAEDPTVVHSPPLLWVEALELLLNQMVSDGVDMGSICAVAGSGQQHGTVYLNGQAEEVLAALDPARTLKDNLVHIFSRPTAPIWMDSSTEAACASIRKQLGGSEATIAATGSDACERFSGPQIHKFAQEEPEAYQSTRHIALVSSFMASILAGKIAPIDFGDASGMNLMDIRKKSWHPQALAATAEDLATRLPPVVSSDTVIGPISHWFVEKFGFTPDTQVVVWTGDNPASAIGTGLLRPGMTAISLGTSDTCFGIMEDCKTDAQGEGHVFGSPTGDYMSLICFKNGSLAREQVRDAYGYGWGEFSDAIKETPAGNEGRLMLPWFETEIVPKVLTPGVHRKDLDPADGPANCRAVVEAQMLSMRLHSRWMGVEAASIYVTGGASANQALLQIMADVNNCPVFQFETTNTAALGAALRAAQAHTGDDWTATGKGFTDPAADSQIDPQPEAVKIYREMLEAYAAFESEHR
jgi:xylulokinase